MERLEAKYLGKPNNYNFDRINICVTTTISVVYKTPKAHYLVKKSHTGKTIKLQSYPYNKDKGDFWFDPFYSAKHIDRDIYKLFQQLSELC